jgi:HK97 family phage major capsid protein
MTVDEIVAAQDALIEGAEGRELTDEECARYEQMETDLGAARRREQLAQRHSTARAVATPALIARVGDGPGEDALNRAFCDYLRTGVPNADIAHLRSNGGVEQRAQSESVATAGGFLVPDDFRNQLVRRLKAYGGLQDAVQEINTSDGRPLIWPTLDDTSNVGEIVAEAGTFSSGADLVFGQGQLGAYKYVAGGASSAPLRISWELLQDAQIDIVDIVTTALAERIGRIMAVHVVRGTGVGQPQGIVTGRTPVQTAATTGGITYADLLTWIHSVDPAYRANGRWVFNDATLALIRGILDGDNRPLLTNSTAGIENAPGGERLLGYPVTVDQAFVDFDNDDSTDKFGVFGDLRRGYVIRRVRDVTIVVNPYSRASNFQTEYSAYARMDAIQQDTNAYIVLSGKS